MQRRLFLSGALSTLAGCGLWRLDLMSPYLRSELVTSPEKETAVLEKASLTTTQDGRIRVLHVSGTPYEMGYQHGALLRAEVQDNLGYMYDKALDTFLSDELFDEAYERLRPHIPQQYIDEMHGLAHGSKLPLRVVHAIHALPSMSEWGGKKAIKKRAKQMMRGELGTSCSNLSAGATTTADGEQYVVRILDWGLHRISKLHEYPLITVAQPENGIAFANIGWVGFLGAVSGMNAAGITLGEMGYGSPPNETLHGVPMIFLLREVLQQASNLQQVQEVISSAKGTNSFVYLMSDGKTGEAELYIRDADRFIVFAPGEDLFEGERSFPAIPGISYGGHYDERMSSVLTETRGDISVDLLQEKIIPEIAMQSNFQNVIYAPGKLQFWVNNAKSKSDRAAEQPYSFFDLKDSLRKK